EPRAADGLEDRRLVRAVTDEDHAGREPARRRESADGIDDDVMTLHHPQSRDESDEGAVPTAEPLTHRWIGTSRAIRLDVGAARDRDDAVRGQEARGQILATARLRDRDDERGRAAIEPAIAGVRTHGLRDVTGTHDRRAPARPPRDPGPGRRAPLPAGGVRDS